MVGVPQGLSHLWLSVTVAEEIGKSSRHSNRSGKVQSLVAIKGRPTARGGCGRGWEAGFQGLGIISLPEARSEAPGGQASQTQNLQADSPAVGHISHRRVSGSS